MNSLSYEITQYSANLLVDGAVLNHGDCIDYRDLVESVFNDGDYFILTCGCGVAGCAGLFTPIEVTSDAEYVYWHIIQPAPERRFTFSKREYADCVKEMLQRHARLPPNRGGQIPDVPCGFDEKAFQSLIARFKNDQ